MTLDMDAIEADIESATIDPIAYLAARGRITDKHAPELVAEVRRMERLMFGASAIICKFANYENIKGDHAKQVAMWLADLETWLEGKPDPDPEVPE